MITTVKIAGDGYLVDTSLQVPNDPANRHYQQVQDWIAEGNTPEPEFTAAEILDKARAEKVATVRLEAAKRITDREPENIAADTMIAKVEAMDQAAIDSYDETTDPDWPIILKSRQE